MAEHEEDEPVGFVRNHRPTGPPRERPWKHKTPRRPRDPLEELSMATTLEEPQAPVVELPVVAVARPPEKKEEVKEMASNVTPVKEKKIPFPALGFEICPACGQYSKHVVHDGEPYLVCKACDDKWYAYMKECDEQYRVYADKVALEIAAGSNPVVTPKVVQSKLEWILARLDIVSMEKELADARLMMEIHNKRYARRAERIAKRIRDKTNGKTMPQEVLVSLRNLYEKEVTKEDAETAKNDIDLVRYLNTWFTAVKKFKPELEQKIAERAARAAAPVPDAPAPAPETPAPAPTAEAPTEPAVTTS